MYQVFVVEDELLIRQNIRHVIESMPGRGPSGSQFAFCGEASDGEMALSMMQELMPDIVLTDIRMPFLDGFELIRHAKAMMPWLKIVIISGYGDFESAQKAISLSVDQYLLKPIRPPELMKVIEEMGQRIEADKKQNTLAHGYDTDEVQYVLRQHFMQQLLYGGLHTSTLLEKARRLQMDVIRPYYQLALFSFGQEADYSLLQIAVQNLMQRLNMPLYCFSESNQLTVLCDGQDAEQLSETVYRFNTILRHELRELCPTITTVVGSPVQRLSQVCQSYRTAGDLLRKVYGLSVGQVVDVNDAAQIAAEMIELGDPFGEVFKQKLQRAAASEVPALVDEALQSPDGNRFGSTLMRYYALIDLLKMTVQQAVKSGSGVDAKDVATQLSGEYDVMAASGQMDTFRRTAVELLTRAVSLREENLNAMKYSHVISRAEKYVAENFCDPNISLISVAKYVGLSSAHFSTVFSQTEGRSFINYLTQMRIGRAKELLATTGMKLSTIAMEIGYNEPNYFSHVFRKLEGITPKEYRTRCQQGGDQ
ncbi:MAG: helix-turn-helix domain-containing protein [Clostridia bacterium]|nr:helix-turn-helix domain-containing protein [Clostridia bacterium]